MGKLLRMNADYVLKRMGRRQRRIWLSRQLVQLLVARTGASVINFLYMGLFLGFKK
jgi:hypothetical protein